MQKNQSLYLRLSEKELDAINSVWFDYVAKSGKPVSRSEFIRQALAAYILKYREVIQHDSI